jgi:hypothetical protein
MKGYWMRPRFHRDPQGGDLVVGPVQINWYGDGWRVYLTWPGRTRAVHFG